MKYLKYAAPSIIALLALASLYQAFYLVMNSQNTGVLFINTTATDAKLTISRASSEAKPIGSGSTEVRLGAGTYQVTASLNGNFASSIVHVIKKQSTDITLSIASEHESQTRDTIYGELPYMGPAAEYQIDIGQQSDSQNSQFGLVISAPSPIARQDALQWIRDEGYDVSDYKISFENVVIVNNHFTDGVPE